MIRLSNKRLNKVVSNGFCRPPAGGIDTPTTPVIATSPVLGEKYKRAFTTADLDWRDKNGRK